jgi:hypothetical protein
VNVKVLNTTKLKSPVLATAEFNDSIIIKTEYPFHIYCRDLSVADIFIVSVIMYIKSHLSPSITGRLFM